jgi:hypothetical protein
MLCESACSTPESMGNSALVDKDRDSLDTLSYQQSRSKEYVS